MQTFVTTSALQTKKLGSMLAEELRGGEIICLTGDLGAGKTTFTQGLLKGLRIKGPYTSPTFVVIKNYKSNFKFKISNLKLLNVYHIDAYRIGAKDLLDLGWKDFAGKKDSIVILEWPENVKKIIPTGALWIELEWLSEKERRITLSSKK
ncbi:MAG TPA: tRNA (adenosine(37)-N6)-threonylcarbamoyltransferase complex ATPase subunit type 1 TsaE [Patescibacteria group bacterium]